MLNGKLHLPNNLSIRLAAGADKPFIDQLYNTTRDDLRMVDGERDFVESLITMQQQAQAASYETQYPNAYHFIVDYLDTPVGRVMIDFGEASIHVIDIAFIPKARGLGYGALAMRALQQAAQQVSAPMTLWIHRHNLKVRNFYAGLGFASLGGDAMNEKLIWHPAQTTPH